jgi:NAD-dependent dihydropyrimidine dehydrogenase PreA subunit
MAIDPSFENTYEEVDRHEDHRVWTTDGEGLTEDKQGIHGTHATVDFDICIADGICLEDYPVDVFEWTDTLGHPESEIMAVPIYEDQCIDCMLCVDVCPVDAIDVDPGRAGRL